MADNAFTELRSPRLLLRRLRRDDVAALCAYRSLPEVARYQSWEGVVHGGMVALMLDEAVGWAAWHAGHPGVTGRLQVSLRRPLKLGERVKITGRVDSVRRTLVYVSAWIENADDGSRVADATATLMETKTVVEPIG